MNEFPAIDGVRLIGQQMDTDANILAVSAALLVMACGIFVILFAIDKLKNTFNVIFCSLVTVFITAICIARICSSASKTLYTVEITDTAAFNDVYNQFEIVEQIGPTGYKVKVKDVKPDD